MGRDHSTALVLGRPGGDLGGMELPDTPPAVIVNVESGVQAEYVLRPTGLVIRAREAEEVIATDRFGPLTVTTTPGTAAAYTSRPNEQIVKAPVDEQPEDR